MSSARKSSTGKNSVKNGPSKTPSVNGVSKTPNADYEGVGKKGKHNEAMADKNKPHRVEFNPDSVVPVEDPKPEELAKNREKTPTKVDNTKGLGDRPPSARAESPVIYDLPKNKQGVFAPITFLNPLEKKYECPVCKDFMRYPVQFEECGHRVCSSCLQDMLKVKPVCPRDGKKIEVEKIFPDSAVSREIGGLKCKCSNHLIGCTWVGELRNVAGHQEGECRFVTMECPNRCGQTFERRSLDTHIAESCSKRHLNCPKCHEVLAAHEIEQHEGECPKAEVECPNECGAEGLLREELENHVEKDCGVNKVHCTYYEAGCLHMCPRTELAKHIRTEALTHLDLVSALLFETRKLVNKHEGFMGGSSDFLKNLGSQSMSLEKAVGSQLLWRIEGLAEKVGDAKAERKVTQYSKQFFTGPHGYKLLAAVCLNGTGAGEGKFIAIYVFICKGEWDALLPWPFKSEITITILDCQPDISKREDITYSVAPDPEDSNMIDSLVRPTKDRNPYFGVNKFAPLKILSPQSNYVENDCLYIQVVVNQTDIPAL